jgi:hypothetical protein
MKDQKPSIGRIVHYHQPEEPAALPAIITHVHSETCVSLVGFTAFPPTGPGTFIRASVILTDKAEPGCWSWPPHV